jgi:hypothetical protein
VSDELSIPRSPVYRVPRRGGPDPLTRRLMLIAGGLAGALVLIVVAWSSVGHHGGAVPVVQADQRPVRVKPANPGGMQIPGLSADAGDSAAAAGTLAPAPETPDPQALARQTPPPAPAATQSALPQSASREAAASQVASQGGPSKPEASQPAAPRTTMPQTAATQTAALSKPLAPTAVAPVIAAAPLPATAAPSAAAKPAQLAAAAADHHAAAADRGAGRTQVQLAALATEAAARHEWERLAHRMPSVFNTHHPVFSKVEHDGHTLWRLRTGDFATEAEASQFCQEVRAKGAGCAVAAF